MASCKKIIFLIIVFLPVYLLRLDIFGMRANLLDILMLAAIIPGFYYGKKIFYREPYRKYAYPLMLIFIGLLAGTLLGGNPPAGLGIIKSWFVLPLAFALVAKQAFSGQEQKIVRAIFGGALLAAITGIAYYFLGATTYDGRLQAFFNSPNYLAMYLAPGIMSGLFLFAENKKIYGTGLLILISAFYLTFSYAAWLALIVATALLMVSRKKAVSHKFRLTAMFLVLILTACLAMSQKDSVKLTDLQGYSRSSLESRSMIWKSAVRIIADNWLIGIGPGNFQQKYLEYQQYYPPYLEWAVPHPHNLLLSFWLSAGLAGLVGFCWLMILWFKENTSADAKGAKLLALAVMIYVLVHGLVDTTYFKNDLAVVFWLIFWLPVNGSYRSSR